MDPLVIKVPEEILERQECLGRTGRRGIPDNQDLKVTQVLVEHQEPLASLDPKDPLEEWACQVYPDKKVCLASPANRASLAHLERKEPKERKDRQVYLALGFPGRPATRETRDTQVSQAALARRERKAAPEPQGCQGPQAQGGLQGASAIQEAQACLERRETKASQDWMAFLASKEKQVSLGLLVLQVQLARRESLAAMASLGQRARRASQVFPEEASQDSQGTKETKVPRVKWASLA